MKNIMTSNALFIKLVLFCIGNVTNSIIAKQLGDRDKRVHDFSIVFFLSGCQIKPSPNYLGPN